MIEDKSPEALLEAKSAIENLLQMVQTQLGVSREEAISLIENPELNEEFDWLQNFDKMMKEANITEVSVKLTQEPILLTFLANGFPFSVNIEKFSIT